MAKEDVKVIIGGDAQKAVKSIQEVTQHMGKMGGAVSDFLGTATGFLNWQTAAAAGLGAVAAGFGKLISDAINTADELANMSKRTGIAVESLSRLSYVAKMSDTDMGTLQKSMKFLNNALYDVSKGNKEAIDKFAEFGIEVKNADGTVKDAESALIAAAEAYTKLESEAAKTALATEIFGKAGQELMPMLSEGAAGIAALTDEAEKMGVVVSTQTAQAAEEFNDKLDKMKGFAAGVANQVLNDLSPAITKLTASMDDFNGSGSATVSTADGIGIAFRVLGTSLTLATRPIRYVFGMLSQGAKGIGALMDGDFGNAAKYLGLALIGDESYVDTYNMLSDTWSFGGGGKGGGQKLNVPTLAYDPWTGGGGLNVPGYTPFQLPKGNTGGNTGGYGGGGGRGGGSRTRPSAPEDLSRYRPTTAMAGFDLANQWITDLTAAAYGDPEKINLTKGSPALTSLDFLDVPALDPNILRDRQQPLIDQWAAYYEELQNMGTTNFLIMNETTQQLFGGMGEAITGLGNLMSSMAGKTQQDYQAMFEIGKAFKAAEIVTSTYSAAMKAYDSQIGIPVVGPYLAVAAAASAIAFGTAQLANLWAAQPGQSSISGASAAPTPNFQQRNPQGGESGGNRTIVIRYEGLIYGDKDKIARDLYDAFAKAGRDGMGR